MPRTLEITFGINPIGVSDKSSRPDAIFIKLNIHSQRMHPPIEILERSNGLKYFYQEYFETSLRISIFIFFI